MALDRSFTGLQRFAQIAARNRGRTRVLPRRSKASQSYSTRRYSLQKTSSFHRSSRLAAGVAGNLCGTQPTLRGTTEGPGGHPPPRETLYSSAGNVYNHVSQATGLVVSPNRVNSRPHPGCFSSHIAIQRRWKHREECEGTGMLRRRDAARQRGPTPRTSIRRSTQASLRSILRWAGTCHNFRPLLDNEYKNGYNFSLYPGFPGSRKFPVLMMPFVSSHRPIWAVAAFFRLHEKVNYRD